MKKPPFKALPFLSVAALAFVIFFACNKQPLLTRDKQNIPSTGRLAQSPEATVTGGTVPLATACEHISQWIAYVKDQASQPENFVKAFLIPKGDFMNMAEDMERNPAIVGFRAYLGADQQAPKLYLIAVVKEEKDGEIQYNDLILPGTLNETPVYDFTKPCPSTCDLSGDSPLDQAARGLAPTLNVPAFENPEKGIVSLSIACENISQWMAYVKGQANQPQNFVKAWLIPKQDIVNMATDMRNNPDIVGFRAYMGAEENTGTKERVPKLYIIAVVQAEKDGETRYNDLVLPGKLNETPVYNFSKPCPNTCDLTDNSPLFQAATGRLTR